LAELKQVGFALEQLHLRRALRLIKAAFRTSHSVRALVEEVIGAVPVSEIVELPGFSSCAAGTNDLLVYKHLNRAHRLSCHRFRSNQVRLALSLPAYNPDNLWRRLALPKSIESWSLTSLQQRLVKTGGRLVKHARYY